MDLSSGCGLSRRAVGVVAERGKPLRQDEYFLPGHFSNQAFPGPPISFISTIRLKFN